MLNSTLYAFLLSFLAGISTVIGSFVVFFDKKKESRVVSYSLSFASGVMIFVSLFDLLPNCYNLIINNDIFLKILFTSLFMVLGIIISMFIDKNIPDYNNKDSRGLYKVGIISMIAIIMHNIPEGIATFLTTTNNIKLGITLSIAIALHNVPEGISIAIPIYHCTNSKKKAIIYSLVSGMSEVLGSILAFVFLKSIINNFIMGILYALIAGIMLQISFYELIPVSYKNGSLKLVFKGFIIGFIIMLISHFIM